MVGLQWSGWKGSYGDVKGDSVDERRTKMASVSPNAGFVIEKDDEDLL